MKRPIAVALLVSSGASALSTEPLQLALLVPSLALAWMITFSLLFAIGTLAFFVTKAMGLLNLYFGLFSLLSGYLLPLPLLPAAIRRVAEYAPFRFMLSVPVELMTRPMATREIAELLALQAGWAVATLALALWLWHRGVRRFEAVGG